MDSSIEEANISTAWYNHDPPIRLGESPIYRDADCTLHWVDFISSPCRIFILPLQPSTCEIRGPPRVLEVPLEYISVIRFCKNRPGTYICAYARGIAFLDEETGKVEVVRELVSEEESARGLGLNDGGIDPQGRFWVGGLDLRLLQRMLRSEEPPEGGWKGASKLWIFDGTDCKVMAHDVMCGNGIGWSPDGEYMYFNDSGTQVCWKYDFDGQTGVISNPTKIVDGLGATVLNDGMTIDQNGNLWIAQWNDHCVQVYTPNGRLIRRVNLPAKCVTCAAWVGKRRDVLIITTAQPLTGEDPPGDQGGSLFRYESNSTGLSDFEFAG